MVKHCDFFFGVAVVETSEKKFYRYVIVKSNH